MTIARAMHTGACAFCIDCSQLACASCMEQNKPTRLLEVIKELLAKESENKQAVNLEEATAD